MKKTLLLLLSLAFTCLHAQNGDDAKSRTHEIGFGFTNIFNVFGAAAAAYSGYYFNQDDYGPSGFGYFGTGFWGGGYGGYGYWDYGYGFNPGYGVTYKYHLNPNGAIRTGIDFSTTNSVNNGTQSYNVPGDSVNKFNLKTTKFVFKAGYQFEKQIRKILVYGGADAFYYMNKSDYEIDLTFNSYFDEKGTSDVKGFGITPLGGVLFRIGDMFSISTEARLRLGSYTFQNIYSGNNPNLGGVYSGENSGKSFETRFSPIGLIAFNIHL